MRYRVLPGEERKRDATTSSALCGRGAAGERLQRLDTRPMPCRACTRTARSPCFTPFLASAAGLMCLCNSQGCADLMSYVFKPAEVLSFMASRCSTHQKCGTLHIGAQRSTVCRPRVDQVVHGARRCLPGAQQHVHTAAVSARAFRLVRRAHPPPPLRCTKQQEEEQQAAQCRCQLIKLVLFSKKKGQCWGSNR